MMPPVAASGSWRRWASTGLALLVTVVAITVGLSRGDGSTPQKRAVSVSREDEGPREAGTALSQTTTDPALVTRMLDDLRAGRKTESQDKPLAGASVEVIRASPNNPAPIGDLRIPAIDLRTEVFEGVNEAALKDGPGHWPGTPAPGEPGNFVLSGHRSTETRPFLYLDQLSRGDLITMTQGNARYRYAVDTVTIVPQRDYVPYVLQRPDKPGTRMITLFACNPLTAHYQRIVVRAQAVDGRVLS